MRPSKTRIEDRTEVTVTSNPQDRQIVASPVKQAGDVGHDTTLLSLMHGLSTLSPALSRYGDEIGAREVEQAQLAGANEGAKASLLTSPMDAINNPASMPENVNPAFGRHFTKAYNETVGKSYGLSVRNAFTADYAEVRGNFANSSDLDAWISQRTAEEFKGLSDPVLMHHALAVHMETVKAIREDHNTYLTGEVLATQRQKSIDNFGAQVTVENVNDPEYVARVSNETYEASGKAVYSRTEWGKIVLGRLVSLSNEYGGTPELFDALKVPGAGGLAPYGNAELRPMIDSAVAHAEKFRADKFHEKNGEAIATSLANLNDMVDSGKITSFSQLLEHYHPNGMGAIRTEAQLLSMWSRAQGAAGEVGALEGAKRDILNGNGAWVAPKYAKAAYEALTAPLVEIIKSGDVTSPPVKQAIANLAVIHAGGGGYENEGLKRFLITGAKTIPEKGGAVPPNFKAAAQIYSALPDNLKGLYTDEESRDVYTSFLQAVNDRTEESTAFSQATRHAQPADRAVAKQQTDDLRKSGKLNSMVDSAVRPFFGVGMKSYSQWLLDKLPFGESGMPDNMDSVYAVAGEYMRNFITQNPNSTDTQRQDRMDRFLKDNYVFEEHNNTLVRVPPGQSGEKVGEAISEYNKDLEEAYPDAGARLEYDERTQAYRIHMVNEQRYAPGHQQIALPEILQASYVKKHIVGEEAVAFARLKNGLRSEDMTPDELAAFGPVIEKARRVGLWQESDQRSLTAITRKHGAAHLNAAPPLFNGVNAPDRMQMLKPPKASPKMTGEISSQFMQQGHYAAALITQGEAVRLRAYEDPALGAGLNIGMGYNLDANEKNVEKDFRAAGIPFTSLEDLKKGKQELTPEQAMKLLLTVVPRYEQMAAKVVDAQVPGTWERLPAPQKAALTDLAYQLGERNLAEFKESIAALAKGTAASQHFRVKYRTHAGEMKEDSRRNNLRLQMIVNPEGILALANTQSSKPN